MEKPRIIIADTDPGYALPLLMKFAEEMYEQAELEVITDREYFRGLFTRPQQADVLVVSESLYTSELRRHNISNIFVMMEQPQEDGYTADLNLNRLYKYTSIKEIYTEITGISAESLDIRYENKKKPQILLVTSACGGTGKTTVAMGIAACLSRQYQRVLYIGADRLQTFQYLLKNSSPIVSPEIYAGLSGNRSDAYGVVRHAVRREGFSYVPPFRMALMSLGLEASVFLRIALGARDSGEFDYVVIDADSTFDEDKASLMDHANRVVIVTRQTEYSVRATNQLVDNINGINSEKYLFVCNDYSRSCGNALIGQEQTAKFIPNEYILHMEGYERMKSADFAWDSGIQKAAVLVM